MVLPLIEILTPKENTLMSLLGTTQATDMVHINMTDTLDTAASAAVREGEALTGRALTTPARVSNVVQVIAKTYVVTDAQKMIQHWHSEDELSRQRTKGLTDWGNSTEFDLMRSTLVSGVSGTIPKMSGVLEAISRSTTYSAQTSGTVWSASVLKGCMKANWDASNGDVATDLILGSYLKSATDDFANKTQNVITGANVREVILSTDVFETGLGKVAVHTSRYLYQSGDATGRVLGIRPDKLKIAYLQRPYVKELPSSGPYTTESVIGMLTLEVRNRTSNFYQTGLFIG